MVLEPEKSSALAHAVFDAVIEPLVVLDADLRIVLASRSFYRAFEVTQQETERRLIYEVGNRQWDIPELRVLLEKILPEQGVIDGYEVDRDFPGIGRRTISVSARRVFYQTDVAIHILLALTDITASRLARAEMRDLLQQKEVLLQELQHRVANSLSIIASILLLKARTVQSEETRTHLEDAHKRVLSVAAVQDHLHASGRPGSVHTRSYLTRLCQSLSDSMVGEERPISISVGADEASVSSSQAVSLGLIVTELVINALKHAFPDNREGSWVRITYQAAGSGWNLTVADNGVGKPDADEYGGSKPGLGTSIVKALAQQLDARIETNGDTGGTIVRLTHSA